MKSKITAQMVVANDEKWVWYSIMSVLEYVDEIIIVDTGSTDSTTEIIESIKSRKIKIIKNHISDPSGHTKARNMALDMCSGDWLFILDGDEVWTKDSIESSLKEINGEKQSLDYLISHYKNCVGDVFHYQEESAGKYIIQNTKGHITTRFFNLNSINKLQFSNDYPLERIEDRSGVQITENPIYKFKEVEHPYLHMTHLPRTSSATKVYNRSKKYKYELGFSFPKDFKFPPCFYISRPKIVNSPWDRRSMSYILISILLAPALYIKRRLFR